MRMRVSWFALLGLVAGAAFASSPADLWEIWPTSRFTTTAAPCLRHAELMTALDGMVETYGDAIRLEEVGESFLGRPIKMLTVGRGPRKVLLWSQMHGNEPSATPALLDMTHYLLSHADEAGPRAILDELTLLMIPMLNPDGTELYRRRNAQAIDINRDALNLTTPEGRILKAVRDRHQPMLGFNLHDQNRRKAVADTGVLSTNSVLAVAGDPEGTETPGRLRAKRACSAIVKALAPFMPEGMSRYDEDWSPRAFGDNITAWGTPVVLIESGGLPEGHDLNELTRLNFVAVLTVLEDLAVDDLAGHDPEIYESLPRSANNAWAEVAFRDGYLLQPGAPRSYRADLSFYLFQDDRQLAGCETDVHEGSRIFEIGDNRFIGGGTEIDARDSVLMPPFVVGAEGWRAREWLDEETLTGLADLGVGTLRWSVSRSKQDDAGRIASRLAESSPVEVQVIASRTSLPEVVLTGPPAPAKSNRLADVLAALGGPESLEALWPAEFSVHQGPPALRRGLPATFLRVAPAPDGEIDLQLTALVSVWHDGTEIRQTP